MSLLIGDDLTRLNQKLKIDKPWGVYRWVKVLTMYWEEPHGLSEGFSKEAKDVAQLFRDLFKYHVEEFVIPLTCSTRRTRQYLLSLLNEAEEIHTNGNGPCLLILHYGGHGDRDDHHHSGQERRAVWAASSASDSALLEWYAVQKELEDVSTDVVLLLDCCFAAQAARHRSLVHNRIEMLAAAAMGVKTAWPGPTSFTNALIRTLRRRIASDGYATISTLATDLSNKEVNLETPVHIVLRHGSLNSSIKLTPFEDQLLAKHKTSRPELSLRLLATASSDLKLDEVVFWLRSNIPRDISFLQVEEVLRTTHTIQDTLADVSKSSETPIRTLDPGDVKKLAETWSAVGPLLTDLRNETSGKPSTTDESRDSQVLTMLQHLKDINARFIDNLEHKLLQASQLHHDESLETLIEDKHLQALGIADHLQLRKIISSQVWEDRCEVQEITASSIGRLLTGSYVEFKDYGEYLNPAHLPIIESRVRMLAELLNARKSSEFLAMSCVRWYHEPERHRFTLEFDIFNKYRNADGLFTTVSLSEAIRKLGVRRRPSLGQRFSIAHKLGIAIKKWHSLGWVHQSISSHSIVFFHRPTGEVDYDSPFLQGFDFARPSNASSILSYIDNVEFNIYRHASRQGPLREGHKKIHDIYSLGVVLLEIGLWETAPKTAGVSPDRTVQEQYVDQTQAKLKSAAANRLSHYAGKDFQEAVVTCLTGEFGIVQDDSAESHLANAYQKQILEKLRKSDVLR